MRMRYIMNSDSENSVFGEDENVISICELRNSSSEDSDWLAEEFHQNSMNEWEWDVNNSDFSTSCDYFDGCAFRNNKIIRSIDLFYTFISQDVI